MNVSPKERTENVNLRVTPEEKRMLKLQAAALGMTVTSYLLGLARAATKDLQQSTIAP